MYYLIAGNGEKKQYLEGLIHDLHLDGRVKLLGYRRDIGELYKASDVCVFPSIREGLPVALMEAMASGLPAVCSKIRGNVDLADENGCLFFDPHSVDECKNAVQTMIEKDYTVIGKNNITAIKKYDVENILNVMKKIYQV